MTGRPPQHNLIERLHRTRAAHRTRNRVYRTLFALTGIVVTVVGAAMLVLPGPALAVIPVGLFMVWMGSAWAGGLLGRALERGEKARRAARAAARAQRILGAIAAGLAVAGAVVAALIWDLPVLPV